ncbi:MAG: permease prefix domain 1-containing protein [Pirellulales bacterium]
MSQQEFDNYLNLLSSMLRLTRKQRAAIADEFRSHLEDRLEDLLSRGVSREQAIEMALSEFGDAAGLAGELSVVSSIRRKRWLMRVSALSLAASVLLGLGLLSFWPDARQAVAPALAIAQGDAGPMPGGVAPPAIPANKPKVSLEKQIEAEINESLNTRVDVEFDNVPLKDVLVKLGEQTQLQFYVDTAALTNSSIDPDLPISISLKQISMRSALKLILGGNQLTYIPDDGFIRVTTTEQAESLITVRVYNCRDILFSRNHFFGALANAGGAIGTYEYPIHAAGMGGMGGGGMGGATGGAGGGFFGINDEIATGADAALPQLGVGGGGGGLGSAAAGMSGGQPGGMGMPGAGPGMMQSPQQAPTGTHQRRAQQLMHLITATVNPETWSDSGGIGAIAEFDGLLVVTQTSAVHQGVENVLTMLRESAEKSDDGMELYRHTPSMPGMMPGMPGMMGPPGGGPPPGPYYPSTPGTSPPRTDSGYEPPPGNTFPPGASDTFGRPGAGTPGLGGPSAVPSVGIPTPGSGFGPGTTVRGQPSTAPATPGVTPVPADRK